MARAKTSSEPLQIVGEAGPEVVVTSRPVPAIGETLSFADVLRMQRKLEAQGLIEASQAKPRRKRARVA